MAAPTISEKTLEVNLCEEIIREFRESYPKAFWYGPTQREENKVGFDESLEGVEGHVRFLQFKRPDSYSGNPRTLPYWFSIQKHQNNVLLRLARKFPGCVSYVFPLIGDLTQLTESLPHLCKETNFTLLEKVGRLTGDEKHQVEVWHNRIRVHSPKDVQSTLGSDFTRVVPSQGRVLFIDFVRAFETVINRHYVFHLPVVGHGPVPVTDLVALRALFLPTSNP